MEEDTCIYDSVDDSLMEERETLTIRIDDDFVSDLSPAVQRRQGRDKGRGGYSWYTCSRSSSSPSHHRSAHAQKSCCQSQSCTACLYLVIVLCLLSSVVSLLVLGVLIVAPYHRADGFISVGCNPVLTLRDYVDSRCSCGEGCISQIPCIRVIVRVTDPALGPNQSWTAVLAEDESKLGRQCSFYPLCNNSTLENQIAISQYVHQYGIGGQDYTCLYNPRHVTQVIRTRRFRIDHVVHALLWPITVFLGSAIALKLMLRYRGCKFL